MRHNFHAPSFTALVFSLLMVFSGTARAQDCNQDPEPAQCVCQINTGCGAASLDGYCLDMMEFSTPFPTIPGCPGNVFNNPHWLGFVATSDRINLSIIPTNCEGIGGGGTMGMQAILYQGSPQDTDCENCAIHEQDIEYIEGQCGCVTNEISWDDLILQPGALYYLVIDGCAGDVCHVEISMEETGQITVPEELDELTNIEWPVAGFVADTICEGASEVTFETNNITGASSYVWTLPNGNVEETEHHSIHLNFPDSGHYNICVLAKNPCDSTDEICRDIVVAPLQAVTEEPVHLCEGDELEWGGVTIDMPGVYTAFLENDLGCSYMATLEVFLLNENEDNPTNVTFDACPGTHAEYHGESFPVPFHDTIVIEGTNGCDSFIDLEIREIEQPDCDRFILESYAYNCVGDSFELYVQLTADTAVHCPFEYILRINGDPHLTIPYGTFAFVGTFAADSNDYALEARWERNGGVCEIVSVLENVDCGDCTADALIVETDSCTGDSTYRLTIGLDGAAAGDSFEVYNGGALIAVVEGGDFPYTIDSFRWSGTPHDQLLVCNADVPDCCYYTFVDPPFCMYNECDIRDLIAEAYHCDGDSFLVDIAFHYSDTGGSGFDLYVNGDFYENYNYNELYITAGPFAGTGDPYHFLVRDAEEFSCAEDVNIESPDCSECNIYDVSAQVDDCDSGSFNLIVNLGYNATGDSFHLQGNGMFYGTFAYSDLPVTLGPLPADETLYELVAIDVEHNDCQSAVEIGRVFCECAIYDIAVDPGECTGDSTYVVHINFHHQNTTNEFFDLYANGELLGFYAYDDLPIVIEHFPWNGGHHDYVEICDNDNADCCAIEEFAVPDCLIGECEISELSAEVVDCDNDTFYVILDLMHTNVGDHGFTITGNGIQYGTFEYESLPLTLGPFPTNNTAWEFFVADVDQPDCEAVVGLGVVECMDDCHLFELNAEVIECENDSFSVVLDFLYDNVGDSGFTVTGNGMQHGTFEYSSLPLTLGPFPANDTQWEFGVTDVDHPDCHAGIGLGEVHCGDDECNLLELMVTTGECSSDESYELNVNFIPQNTIGDHFDLYANGEFFGFYAYDDLPLTIADFPYNGGENDLIEVCDNDNPDCCALLEFPVPDCIPIAVRDIDSEAGIRIYPNPASDLLVLETEKPLQDALLEMYSSTGQLSGRWKVKGEITQIELGAVPEGVYFIYLKTTETNYYKILMKM